MPSSPCARGAAKSPASAISARNNNNDFIAETLLVNQTPFGSCRVINATLNTYPQPILLLRVQGRAVFLRRTEQRSQADQADEDRQGHEEGDGDEIVPSPKCLHTVFHVQGVLDTW